MIPEKLSQQRQNQKQKPHPYLEFRVQKHLLRVQKHLLRVQEPLLRVQETLLQDLHIFQEDKKPCWKKLIL